MKFSQDYTNQEIKMRKEAIEKYQSSLKIEQESLKSYLLNQGYKFMDGRYIHPDYIQAWEDFKASGGYGVRLPKGTVVFVEDS